MIKTLVMLLCATTALAGNPAYGDKAANLTRALRFAGVKPTTAKGGSTFKAATIQCTAKTNEDDPLGEYQCTIDKLVVKDAVAYLLLTAMDAAGVEWKYQMGGQKIETTAVTCAVNVGSDKFQCAWGGVKPK